MFSVIYFRNKCEKEEDKILGKVIQLKLLVLSSVTHRLGK